MQIITGAIIILLIGGALLPFANRRSWKVLMVCAILFLQLLWCGWPRFTRGYDAYRAYERFQARAAYDENPSPKSKAAYDEENKLLHSYLMKSAAASLIFLILLNALVIYYCWTFESRKVARRL
jgi:hypothetical protein